MMGKIVKKHTRYYIKQMGYITSKICIGLLMIGDLKIILQ